MGDRATLERIFAIMRRLLLVPMDGANPIPRKGTTRHECYRALYEIQELLETRGYSGKHLPQTNADSIRNMTDEQFANWLVDRVTDSPWCKPDAPVDQETKRCQIWDCEKCALEWLRQEAGQCTK